MKRGCKPRVYWEKSTLSKGNSECHGSDLEEGLTRSGQQGGQEVGDHGEEM